MAYCIKIPVFLFIEVGFGQIGNSCTLRQCLRCRVDLFVFWLQFITFDNLQSLRTSRCGHCVWWALMRKPSESTSSREPSERVPEGSGAGFTDLWILRATAQGWDHQGRCVARPSLAEYGRPT